MYIHILCTFENGFGIAEGGIALLAKRVAEVLLELMFEDSVKSLITQGLENFDELFSKILRDSLDISLFEAT